MSSHLRWKLIELQGELDKCTVGYTNTPFSLNDRYRSQNSTINQLNIIDIYRLVHSTTEEYTLFLKLHGTFTKLGQYLSHQNTS